MIDTDLSLEDILLLWYVDNKTVGFRVPQYWHYTYKVDNVPQRIQQLEYNGLITTRLEKGKNKHVATEKGKAIINAYPHIIYYHSYRNTLDPYLNLKRVDDLYNTETWQTVEEFFIAYHNSAMGKYWEAQLYGMARNCLLSIAEIHFRQPKYAEALANFLCVSYLDMTGLNNITAYKTDFTEDDKESVQLAPGVISYIVLCLRNLGVTLNDLPEAYMLAVQNIDVAYALYSKQEVLGLIIKELTALGYV